MHITISAIGKLKDPPLKALFEEYKKRLDWKVTINEFEGKYTLEQENEILLKTILPRVYTVLLDEKGESLNSDEFSKLLNQVQLHHQGKACFIIGGADGLSDEIKSKGNKIISFGRMTWPHLFVRVMLMEQIYRAQQILKGHPYHRQ